ncbi:hypothetical protein, partial [Paraglaciecola sp.]|uniref:hypothetical protein n=1 Tax=Paraglaciecola sp. TaxID=1920173 RepID=UPI003EF7AD02
YNPSITLVQGHETAEKINEVLEGTRIKSEPLIMALKAHFIDGVAASMAYMMFSVPQQNFDRAVITLNKTYRKLESDVSGNISLDKVA